MRLRLYSVVLGLAFTVSVFGELNAQTTTLEKVTEELLDVPVEAPDWQEYLRARLKEGWVPPPLPDHTPRDDAPIAELIDHWQVREWDVGRTPKPSERVSERLLKYCENNPASFNSFRWYFEPERKDVIERVQRLFAKLPADVSAEEHQSIENWLMLKANALPDLLRKRATEAFDHPADSSKHEALNFLMLHDWPAAEAMLQRFARSDQAGARGLALISLYQHSLSAAAFAKDRERIRAELQKFVEGQETPDIRANALESLNEPDWPGRAEWILDRFKDEALSKVERPTNSSYPTTVLCGIVKRAPDFWVSKVLPLVGSANRTVHNNAVSCLVQFESEELAVEVTRALLPWLSNPDWAVSVDRFGRIGVVYSLRHFVMPESVPGLIWVLEHDGEFEVAGAAQALAHQGAKESVPALKKSLVKEFDAHLRRDIIQALLKLNGFTDTEKTEAVMAYALQISTEEGREALSQASLGPLIIDKQKAPISPQVSVGETIGGISEQDDALVKQLLQRTKDISTKQPVVAQKIREIIGGWNTESSMAQIMEQLRSGSLSKDTVQMMLSNRARFAKPLASVNDFHGGALVIQALVTSDQKRITEILLGNDPAIQAFLCACARLNRTPLTLPDVARLLTAKNTPLARAAGMYLECIDSVESRTRLLEHRRGEGQILGASDGLFYSERHASYYFGALEKHLRQRVLEKDGPDQVYALLSSGTWGDNGQCMIETRGNQAVLINEQGEGRYSTRDLNEAELQTLRQFLTAHQIEELPPLNLDVDDGIQYEYLRLTKDGGRRVFMNNPGSYRRSIEMPGGPSMIKKGDPDDTIYAALVDQFHSLTHDASKFSVRYHAQKQLPDLHVLIPRETAEIHAVVQDHDQLIVSAQSPGETKIRWRVFKDGQLGADTVDSLTVKPLERAGGPLHNQSWRPLQSTEQPNFVWSVQSLSDNNSITTQIGRHDLKKLKFDPVLTLPGLRFNSMDIWIDEKARLIYITVNGDLLSLSLPADKSRSK